MERKELLVSLRVLDAETKLDCSGMSGVNTGWSFKEKDDKQIVFVKGGRSGRGKKKPRSLAKSQGATGNHASKLTIVY
ncbi:hypothetical protein L3C95_13505 [Chitinophaga filiformis]|uniref:hypothetical protein n=1 Tax=Chitinophaga filiformis TaxID=104663 RepID=UPI001F349964|nr:hypothetical protein [Chitinophaga filiformis]MCF6403903.1 hypothetical protein [Chitinophaga filiformis]